MRAGLRRRICVVTGSRADYGLLYWLIKAVHEDPDLKLQLVVTGSHGSSDFGRTVNAIQHDAFPIEAEAKILEGDDSPLGITKAMARAVAGLGEIFHRLKPNLLVVLGDRYESFAAVQAAAIACIPIAHIHGGETTEGSIDEALRHAITKMAHFHFVSTEVYRRRVIQMGEDPRRVFNYGAPGLDNLTRLRLLPRKRLEEELRFKLGNPTFLVTYHPVTLNGRGTPKAVSALLGALDHFRRASVIFTKSNADAGGLGINQCIDHFVKINSNRARAFSSLGQLKYLSAMRAADVVLGNSSSGIIEAPCLKKPAVNIGERQRGRLKANSVIDCGESKNEIVSALRRALSPTFHRSLKRTVSLYGKGGNASWKIKERLKRINLENALMKKFYDLPISI